MTPADEPYIAMYQNSHTALALAEAELGDLQGAAQRLDALIAKHAAGEGPLTLGNFHAAAVRVAVKRGDARAAEYHRTQVERWFRPTGNPALIAQCERMQRTLLRLMQEQGEVPAELSDANERFAAELESAEAALVACTAPAQRAARALQLVLEHVHATAGVLYTRQDTQHSLTLAAKSSGMSVPASLVATVAEVVRASGLGDDTASELSSSSASHGSSGYARFELGPDAYHIYLLTMRSGSQADLVGGVAVLEGEQAIVPPHGPFLELLARALHTLADGSQVTAIKRPARSE
jgi:hypothetical protein